MWIFDVAIFSVFAFLAKLILKGLFLLAVYFDYFTVFAITYGLVFSDSGFLASKITHPALIILISAIPLLPWYALQQITIFNIYIFRILGAAFSAIMVGVMVYGGNIDVIWSAVIGMVFFIGILALRFKNNSLI